METADNLYKNEVFQIKFNDFSFTKHFFPLPEEYTRQIYGDDV